MKPEAHGDHPEDLECGEFVDDDVGPLCVLGAQRPGAAFSDEALDGEVAVQDRDDDIPGERAVFDRSTMTTSPSWIPASTMDVPEMRTRKVAAWSSISSSVRSIGPAS